jgi:hypothetical protein
LWIDILNLPIYFLALTVNVAPAQSHIWHMLCKICFTIILCWLRLRRIWHTMCQKNGEAHLTHVKQNMLHMWLIVLHLRQLCHIVCHIWLCAGTDLQCLHFHFAPYNVHKLNTQYRIMIHESWPFLVSSIGIRSSG